MKTKFLGEKICMLRLIFRTLILVSIFGSNAFGAESFKSVMSCKILNQTIIENNDSNVQTYVGYKDDLKVGDTFFIRYTFYENNDEVTAFKLERSQSPSFVSNSPTSINKNFEGSFTIDFRRSDVVNGGGGKPYAYFLTNDKIKKAFQFRRDSIKATYAFDLGGMLLKLMVIV